jgi:plastocyanin
LGTNKIILLLIVLSVVISGCLSSEDEENEEEDQEAGGSSGGSQRPRQMTTPLGTQEEMWTAEETETEGEMWTAEETETEGEMWTAEEMGTPVETVAQEELETQTETETQEELGTPRETAIQGAGGEAEAGQMEEWTEEGGQAVDVQSGGTVQTTHPVRLKDYLMIPPRLEINTGETVIWRNYQESSVLFLTSREYLFEDQRLVYGDTFEYTFNEPGSYNFSVKGYPKMQMTITVK